MSTLARRLLTLPLLFVTAALLILTMPLWLPLALVAGALFPGARSAARVIGFITAYACCEVVGVTTAFLIWLRHGRRRGAAGERAWLAANYALQAWWVRTLKWWAVLLFRLSFVVEGEDALRGDGTLLILRHCSIGDTFLPVVFYGQTQGLHLRFVLKRELLFDPCLDIVGNRLPNYFADRSSQNTARELEGVKALLEDLPADSGVLIYPEGTRFSPAKRAALIARLREKGDAELLARAESLHNVLPPRTGGTLALMEANPGRDLLFCAHTGFEGSADFASLFNGSWLDTTVRMRFWRLPWAELPKDPEGQRALLFEAWERMDREVADLL